MCTAAAAAQGVTIQSGEYADGKYTLNFKSEEIPSLIFGAFDGYGRLFDVREATENNVTFNGLEADFDGGFVRAFAWESPESMKPYEAALTADFSQIPEPLKNEGYFFFEEPFVSMGEISRTVTVGNIIFNRIDTNKEIIVNKSGYVELGGGGNMKNCSLGFSVKGNCTINVWARSRSSEQDRIAKIGDANSELVTFDAPCDRVNKGTYVHRGGEKDFYVASKAAAIRVYAIEVIYNEVADTQSEWYVSDYKSLKRALWKTNLNGGTVVINADNILCPAPLVIENNSGEAVALCGGEGYNAVLDFDGYRSSVDEGATSSAAALSVEGSGCRVENIIIENAPYVGLRINNGEGNNLIENVVSRYNGGSGFAMSNFVHDNTLKNCYAYRNCDIITKGENADGFWVAFGAGTGNRLINCYSWENADDGFDSFRMFNEVYYENCFAWRNGVADVHSGKYDFDRGRRLDEKQPLVRRICEYDKSFKENYENGKFILPDGEFLLTTPINTTDLTYISPAAFVGSEWRGNGNGIKMGSGETAETPQVGKEAVRTLKNCITFENTSKGFDRNNSACTVYIENGLSFDNYRNYWLDACTIEQFENVLSGSTERDLLPSGFETKLLNTTQLNREKTYIGERIEILEDYVNNDEIPSGVCMERVFGLMW